MSVIAELTLMLSLSAPAQQPQQKAASAQQPAPKQDQKPRTERRRKAEDRAETRTLFTIDGKVRPPDTVELEADPGQKQRTTTTEEDKSGVKRRSVETESSTDHKQRVVYEEDVREAVIGDVVEFERPNLVSKWSPDPITPADVGWCYLVQRVDGPAEVVVQPRLIAPSGVVLLGKPFVVKGIDAAGLKPRSMFSMPGKYELTGTARSKKGTVFFVFEARPATRNPTGGR